MLACLISQELAYLAKSSVCGWLSYRSYSTLYRETQTNSLFSFACAKLKLTLVWLVVVFGHAQIAYLRRLVSSRLTVVSFYSFVIAF